MRSPYSFRVAVGLAATTLVLTLASVPAAHATAPSGTATPAAGTWAGMTALDAAPDPAGTRVRSPLLDAAPDPAGTRVRSGDVDAGTAEAHVIGDLWVISDDGAELVESLAESHPSAVPATVADAAAGGESGSTAPDVPAPITSSGPGGPTAWFADSCRPFPDVTSKNTHCSNITWLKGKGITKPEGGKYMPGKSVNRGSMVTFLYRLTHDGASAPACSSKPFPDVAVDNVHCGAIQWARDTGLAKGYQDGSYGPNNAVTRGAMATFIYRIASGSAAPLCAVKPYKDVASDYVHCGAITWMKQSGLTSGIGGNKYGRMDSVNRASMASFLKRMDNWLYHGGADRLTLRGPDKQPANPTYHDGRPIAKPDPNDTYLAQLQAAIPLAGDAVVVWDTHDYCTFGMSMKLDGRSGDRLGGCVWSNEPTYILMQFEGNPFAYPNLVDVIMFHEYAHTLQNRTSYAYRPAKFNGYPVFEAGADCMALMQGAEYMDSGYINAVSDCVGHLNEVGAAILDEKGFLPYSAVARLPEINAANRNEEAFSVAGS